MEEKRKKLSFKHKRILSALICILCIFLVVLTVSVAIEAKNKIKEGKYIGQDIETRNTITVSDVGEVYAKPDLAVSTFSVVTEGKTVSESMGENTNKMNAIINAMKSEGVSDRDLKTVGFSIYPRYEWRRDEDDKIPYPEGERVLVGYEVSQSLEVKIRDMQSIGHIIEKAAGAGANQAGDLRFTIDDEEGIKKQARELAIRKAKEKARELAEELGIRLVQIASFYESSSYPRYYDYGKGIGGAMAEEAVMAPTIETGESKVEVTVNITYVID